MPKLSVIADDLTGACDTGCAGVLAGLRTMVILDVQRSQNVDAPWADVIVYNTDSRYLPVDQAARAVAGVVANLPKGMQRPISPPHLVYKKIDSTLRGHPGEELAALMRALGVTCALIVPAFPAQRRTTIDGQVLVNGHPLAQTPFASEVASGDLRSLFGGHGYPVHAISLEDVRGDKDGLAQHMAEQDGIIIADAEFDDDLQLLATAAQACGIQVLCGSAGLAHSLLAPVPKGCKALHSSEAYRLGGPLLMIAGSRHPATLRQIEVARARGVAVMDVPPEFGQTSWSRSSFLKESGARLDDSDPGRNESHLIITTARLDDSPLGKHVIAQHLGLLAADAVERTAPGVILLTGGDVATAVCTALNAHAIELLDELHPGIALGRLADGPHVGLHVITKAGGFGDDETLWQLVKKIGSQMSCLVSDL